MLTWMNITSITLFSYLYQLVCKEGIFYRAPTQGHGRVQDLPLQRQGGVEPFTKIAGYGCKLAIPRRRTALLSVLLILCVLLTACDRAPNSTKDKAGSNDSKYGGSVTIVSPPYGPFTRNFNPFLSDSLSGTQGMLFETLLFMNRQTGSTDGWLAKSYTWSSDLIHLTFTLQSEVKWSDGQPLTSDDVVFTFNMLRQHPALDRHSVWSSLNTVTNPDRQTVVFSFKEIVVPQLWYIGGQTYIVPRHIWQNIKDPVKELNPNPVGTGPFILKSFDPTLYTMTRNPSFWQPDKPYIDELRYPMYTSNDTASLFLRQGSIDWAGVVFSKQSSTEWTGVYRPHIQDSFVELDPQHNHYWFPPSSIVALHMNTVTFPFNLLAVRQAISLAIDRQSLSVIGTSGHEPVAHPTGLLLPAHQSFLDPRFSSLSFNVNQAKAVSLLESTGFTKGEDGVYLDPSGKRLTLSLNIIAGRADWETNSGIIAENLRSIGIAVTVNPQTPEIYSQSLQTGNFESAITATSTNSGPTPYFLYHSLLAGKNTTQIGSVARSNWGRWNDATTDHSLTQYAHSLDPAAQQQALATLQQVMVEQLPVLPLVNGVNWYEYTTVRFTGWPSQDNPYAVPSPSVAPDNAQVALRLRRI